MQIEVKGRNLQVTDEMREYVERRFDKIAKQVSELADARPRGGRRERPGRPGRRRGGAAPQGHAAARQGGLQGRQARDQPRRRTTWSARSSAIATSGAAGASRAPRPRRSRTRDADASRKRPAPCSKARPGARSTARLGSYVHPRARPPNGRSEAVQGLLQARRADQRLGGGARDARATTSSRSSSPSCASAPRKARTLDELLPEAFALDPRGRPAHDGDAPLRRAADRRHGAARRPDRRDAHGRGQDPHRHARGRRSTRCPARACTSSRSTTTWPAATRTGCARSTKASA